MKDKYIPESTKNLINKTFGNLKVLDFDKSEKDQTVYHKSRTYYKCECLLCGKIKSIRKDNLLSGNSTSCGCYNSRNSIVNPNSPIIHDDYVEMFTHNGKRFLIDIEDYSKVSPYSVYMMQGNFYIRINKKLISLRKYIMNNNTNKPLICRSGDNSDLRKNNITYTSTWDNKNDLPYNITKIGNTWKLQIFIKGESKYMGCYPTKKSAETSYKGAMIMYHIIKDKKKEIP